MQVCPERLHPKGSTLFRAGDPATHRCVVASGQVKLVVPTAEGRERILAFVGPDDLFGEAFVGVEGDVDRLDAVAPTDVRGRVAAESLAQGARYGIEAGSVRLRPCRRRSSVRPTGAAG